jgi:PAP2 superfamily
MGSPLARVRSRALSATRAGLVCGVLLCLTSRAAAQGAQHSAIPQLGWGPVAAGAGVVVIGYFLDAGIARSVADHATEQSIQTGETLSKFGEPIVFVPVVGGLALAGWIAHQPTLTRTAVQTAGAILLASVVVQPVKYVVGRARPYQDEDFSGDDFDSFSGWVSFPSGHTAAAFALATSLGDASHNIFAQVGLYTLATGTAYGRIATSDHWLSDVLAGAGIGILSAKFASGKVRVFGLQAPKFMIGPSGGAVAWTVALPPVR